MNKPKVVAVDDRPEDIEKLGEILGETFELKMVYQSPKALEVIEEFKPDLVFLDIQMPEENGLEVLKKIKIVQPRLRVIMMTIVKDITVAIKAVQMGASDYLLKPLDPDTVREKVKRLLEDAKVEADLDKMLDQIKKMCDEI